MTMGFYFQKWPFVCPREASFKSSIIRSFEYFVFSWLAIVSFIRECQESPVLIQFTI